MKVYYLLLSVNGKTVVRLSKSDSFFTYYGVFVFTEVNLVKWIIFYKECNLVLSLIVVIFFYFVYKC